MRECMKNSGRIGMSHTDRDIMRPRMHAMY
jgi:hypothetical protein